MSCLARFDNILCFTNLSALNFPREVILNRLHIPFCPSKVLLSLFCLRRCEFMRVILTNSYVDILPMYIHSQGYRKITDDILSTSEHELYSKLVSALFSFLVIISFRVCTSIHLFQNIVDQHF